MNYISLKESTWDGLARHACRYSNSTVQDRSGAQRRCSTVLWAYVLPCYVVETCPLRAQQSAHVENPMEQLTLIRQHCTQAVTATELKTEALKAGIS